MKEEFSKFIDVIKWREFQIIWILTALLVAVFVLAAVGITNGLLLLLIGVLLFLAFFLTFFSTYRTAQTDRGTKVERSELTSILANIDDALIVYDTNFRAIFFNPSAERLFKLSLATVLDHKFEPQDVERPGWQTLTQIIFPSLAPRVISRSKEGEYPQFLDVSFTDPQLEFRITTFPIKDTSGRTLAFTKIVRDRTAQIAAMRSRTEFITIASHQLRGPVTDINWALDSLASASGLNETDKMIIVNAAAASRGLLRRIEDLLNISKMEEGQFGYNFEETDIVELIGKILADVLPAARTAGVKIYFDRPTVELPHVTVDPKRLSLALVNLLENAVRYNVENGEVIVKVDKMEAKPFVEVTVKDTGIGVPPDAMPKLFTKFYRADNAMKSQTEGSGLGLYMARTIVAAHGGEIWVESELNRGTTIHFTLPTDLNLVPKRELGAEDFY